MYKNLTAGKKYWVCLFVLCCWTDKVDNNRSFYCIDMFPPTEKMESLKMVK